MSGGRLPTLKSEELIKGLEKLGFIRARKSKGSHFRYVHSDGRKTTIPVHKGKDISRGLLRKILRDVDISVDELKKWL